MSDLIDRQEAQRLFRKAISFKEHVGKMMWSSSEVKEWVAEFIEDLPSAEPEIIHCKNCKHRESNDCPMYYEEWIEIDEGDGYFDTDNIIHDWTTDEGFCHCAELRGKEE